MRIALCHPTYWPEVRRGSERVVHDLAISLAGVGHDVSILTTHRHRPSIAIEDGVRVVRSWRPPGAPPLRWYEDFVNTIPAVVSTLRRERFDVVHAFHPASAWAAVHAPRRGEPPVIFSFHGTTTRPYLTARRYRIEMITDVARRATATTVLSSFAAESFRRYLLLEPEVLPAGFVGDDFRSRGSRSEEPTLLCAADLSDPRKRGELLLAAFQRLRAIIPEARLVLAANNPDGVETRQPVRGVSFARAPSAPELADLYSAAWASVLPAVDEALGLVMVESLASGTPVVAANSGACPEVITSGTIGRLFAVDDEDALLVSLEEGLVLGGDPETAAACRARAEEFDWSRLVVRYEDLYERVLSRARDPR